MNAAIRLIAAWGLSLGAAFAALPPGNDALTPQELSQGYRQHRILVRPRASREADARNAESRIRARVRRKYPEFGGVRVLELDPGDTADAAIARLQATGNFAVVERDVFRYPLVVPNDPSFGQQWALQNTGQSGGTPNADISATSGWDTRNDASTVIVAIIDTGIRTTHADLVGNLWSSNGIHGINAIGSTTTNDPSDDDGHGTHVAGIIGASGNNGTGISGVAWRTQLMALKFIPANGSGSTSDELECIQYAIAHSAKVINASFGSSVASASEQSAIQSARDAGIIFVTAAGNGTNDDGIGVDNDTAPNYPANYPLDNIVSVAATTRTDALATFSNYGSGAVDLGAPGDEIYSTYNASDTSYATLSGTSMATPQVAGAIALLRAQFPTETYRQIINRLLRGTTRTTALAGKVQSGGRLNLAQALTSTTNRPFNDGFAERAVLTGANVRVRSNNVGATLDNGEPAHGGATVGASLWWSWTAPATTPVVFDTVGSTTSADAPLDTVLAIYTGTAVEALQAVASNDDANGAVTSRVEFTATAGTTYQIAVAGKNSATGMVLLRIGAVPVNDNFASAMAESGESFSVGATLLNATRESGEPDPTGAAAGHSLWYKWTAPRSGLFQLAAFSTQIDTIAAVYTGSAVNSLATVASNQNSSSANSDALVPFNATSGTTYFFQIDHSSSDGTDGGDVTVTLAPALWEYPAGDEATSSPAVGSDGTIYFGVGSSNSFDTKVYAVTSTGSTKWTFTTGAQGIITASPAVGSDGTVYVGGTDKILYALDGTSGSKKWSFAAGTEISSTPAVGADGTIYFRDDTKLYALTSAGAQQWSFALTSGTTGTYASPAIGTNGTIYVGTTGGTLLALNPDGTQKWRYTANDNAVNTTDPDIYTSPAIGADGTIYFANLRGTVYALTDGGSSATRKWSWSTNGESITSSIAVGADGSLYFAAYDHNLYALNSSGTQKWSYTLGDEVRASSPAVAADGTIYIGCYDGKIYAVSPTGALLHAYATARTIRSSPAIANNRLYIGSADAKLYAFDLGQSAAGSAWPMFHRNPARTGLASAVAITKQPSSEAVVVGSTVTLSVTATGSNLTYQWSKDGTAIGGATSATYTIASAAAGDAGAYTVQVTGTGGTATSSSAVLTVVAAGGPSTLMVNISARGYCSTGNSVMIGGFVISGSVGKRVLIRAVGPSLAAQGIAASEALADPTIELHHNVSGVDTVIASNDNWTDNANSSEITSVAAQIGATALSAGDTTSSALLTTLQPGVYSFVAQGKNNASGIVLLEVYDADTANHNARFVDISARAQCQTGNRIAIGGFVVSGTVAKQVLLRAVGPTLTTQGLSAAEVLTDPMIELHRLAGGADSVIASNDDWGTNANADTIRTTAARIGATAFAATDTTSSALLVTLQPGVYSFVASGKNGTSGIVLVEVYDAD